jgi:hypothetical protein
MFRGGNDANTGISWTNALKTVSMALYTARQNNTVDSRPDDVGYYLRGFGQDNDGEIYLAVSSMLGPQGNTGKVFKLEAARDKNY